MDKEPDQLPIVQIGDDHYLVHPKAVDDEPVFPSDVEEVIKRIRANTITDEEAAQYIPDPGARAWIASTRPMSEYTAVYRGLVPDGTVRLCAHDYCTNVITPPKNIGLKKIYCSDRCARRQAKIRYARRRRKGAGWAITRDHLGKDIRVDRVKAASEDLAEFLYKVHIGPASVKEHPCPNGTEETGWRCPAHMFQDYYSKEKRCLIYAVLVDDWKEWMARNRGEIYIRQFSTSNGRWLEKDSIDIHYKDSINSLNPPKSY